MSSAPMPGDQMAGVLGDCLDGSGRVLVYWRPSERYSWEPREALLRESSSRALLLDYEGYFTCTLPEPKLPELSPKVARVRSGDSGGDTPNSRGTSQSRRTRFSRGTYILVRDSLDPGAEVRPAIIREVQGDTIRFHLVGMSSDLDDTLPKSSGRLGELVDSTRMGVQVGKSGLWRTLMSVDIERLTPPSENNHEAEGGAAEAAGFGSSGLKSSATLGAKACAAAGSGVGAKGAAVAGSPNRASQGGASACGGGDGGSGRVAAGSSLGRGVGRAPAAASTVAAANAAAAVAATPCAGASSCAAAAGSPRPACTAVAAAAVGMQASGRVGALVSTLGALDSIAAVRAVQSAAAQSAAACGASKAAAAGAAAAGAGGTERRGQGWRAAAAAAKVEMAAVDMRLGDNRYAPSERRSADGGPLAKASLPPSSMIEAGAPIDLLLHACCAPRLPAALTLPHARCCLLGVLRTSFD